MRDRGAGQVKQSVRNSAGRSAARCRTGKTGRKVSRLEDSCGIARPAFLRVHGGTATAIPHLLVEGQLPSRLWTVSASFGQFRPRPSKTPALRTDSLSAELPTREPPLRELDNHPWPYGQQRRLDLRKAREQYVELRGRKHEHTDPKRSDVLLMTQRAVGGQEDREPGRLCLSKQRAVLEPRPSSVANSLRTREMLRERARQHLIEQDPHAAGLSAPSFLRASSRTESACSRRTPGNSLRKSSRE